MSSSSAASSSARRARPAAPRARGRAPRACARAACCRRSRSIARCLAVAISQAPGLSGTPVSGHCSSAATSASCASSSARPTSRTMRASPAMSRADSMRQTASMARWVSVAVTATDHDHLRRRRNPRATAVRRPAWRCISSKPGRGLLHVRREVRHLLHLADLDHLVLARPGSATPTRSPPPSTSPGSSSSRRAPPSPRRTARRSPWACRRGTMTRAPIDGGCRPSSASSTPAFCSDSLYFIIAATAFGVGHRAGRGALVALGDHQHHESHVSHSLDGLASRKPRLCKNVERRTPNSTAPFKKILQPETGRISTSGRSCA